MAVDSGANKLGYIKAVSTFGTLTTPTATDAVRILSGSIDKKLNRTESPRKRLTPDYAASNPGRSNTNWNINEALWEPSGTAGTASYWDALFTHILGTRHAASLVTTVEASPTPTATGCTLTSATGLSVGDLIVFNVASGTRREVTRVKTLVSSAITFDALSAAPDSLGAAVAGVNWAPATALPSAFDYFLYHTDTGIKEAAVSAICQKFDIDFNGDREVRIKFSGIAKDRSLSPATMPASHTTVGNPASGMFGTLYRGAVAFPVRSLKLSGSTGLGLRNSELFTSTATGVVRLERRKVEVEASFYVEDTTLLAEAEAVTTSTIRALSGTVNGSMIGVVLPVVEWETYEIPDTDGPTIATAKGMAYATSGNDDIFIGEM